MFKILILAYVIGQSPVDTMQTFQMQRTFNTMQECKAELLLTDPVRETHDVMWEFVNDTNFFSFADNVENSFLQPDSDTFLSLDPFDSIKDTSGNPIFALSEATLKWQAIANSKPPPNAKPFIAAITGLE